MYIHPRNFLVKFNLQKKMKLGAGMKSNISAQGTASDVTKDTAATGVIETVTDVKAVIDTDEARPPPPPSYNEHM